MMIMKTMKKITAAVMAFAIIGGSTAFPAGVKPILDRVLTANAADYCCSYNSATGVLTLHGNVVKEDVQKYYSGDVEHEGYYVSKVVCEEGTVFPEDCSYLFADFTVTSEIDLSNADTSNVTNMASMFHCCWSMRNVNLSNFNTSKVTNMNGMFYLCEELPSLDVSSFNTSSVTDMRDMFGACSKLQKLDLSNFDTSNVTDMSAMFYSCYYLTDLDIRSFDTHNVEDMYCMFDACKSLTDLDLSHFDTHNVKSMCRMFDSCYEITNLKFGDFNTSNVTEDSGLFGMFNNCKKLTSLDLSSFDTSNVKNTACMFSGCKSLKEIDISSFDTKKVTELGNMFHGCTNLESIFVSNAWTNSYVKDGENVFDGCTSLVGGNGTAYDPDKTDYNYACVDTEQTPGYLTLIHKDNMLKSTSVTLDGTIGINFYVYINENIEKAILSGPNGDVVTDFTDKDPCGTIKLTYNINATQARDIITLKLYDKNREQSNFIKAGKSPVTVSHYDCTVQEYIDKYKSEYNSGKVYDLVDSLDNYCKAAENYFIGTKHTVDGISDITLDSVKDYAPVLDDNIKLSLVLFSSTNIRVYTDSTDVVLYGNNMPSNTSKYGQYYEFYDAPANRLFEKINLVIDGKKCSFYAMSYVYRVLNDPSADSKLTDIAKATYVYGKAANTYLG